MPAGQRAERQRHRGQVPLHIPPSQICFFGAASTESNRGSSRPILVWRGRGHCRKAESSLVDWPAHCADTQAQRNKLHRVIPGCLLSSQGCGKIQANLAKEDHADPCMAYWSLEMKPERQIVMEHQLRNGFLNRDGSGGVKFRHGLAPGSEKSVIITLLFDSIIQIGKKRLGPIWSTSSCIEAPRRGAMRVLSL